MPSLEICLLPASLSPSVCLLCICVYILFYYLAISLASGTYLSISVLSFIYHVSPTCHFSSILIHQMLKLVFLTDSAILFMQESTSVL